MQRIESLPALRSLYGAIASAPDEDSAHDLAHLLRVALWTLQLADATVAPEEAVAAALLHDLVNIPKNHPDRAKASELSAEQAAPLLTQAGFSPASVERIQAAILEHSFSRGLRPSGPLGEALQDADRLESLGAIGLMRVFSTGARMGAKYFHPADPWAKQRALDDKAYSVDHFFTKLLLLGTTMNTTAGKAEAALRIQPLQDFLQHLGREIGEELP